MLAFIVNVYSVQPVLSGQPVSMKPFYLAISRGRLLNQNDQNFVLSKNGSYFYTRECAHA